MRMGLGLGLTQPQGGFNPASLFADGGNGILWDFTATGPLFTDDAGTTPLTTAAQTIGMVRDGSRTRSPATAYAGVQASAGLRPSYGIAPASRRQLAIYSEDFSNAAWVKNNGGTGSVPTVTSDYGVAPDGTTTAARVQLSLGGGTTSTDQSLVVQTTTITNCSQSWYIKTADGSTKTIYMRGAVAQSFVVTGDWARYSYDVGTTSSTQTGIGLRGGQAPTNSNTADLLVWHPQFESGIGAVTAYQKSVTALEITESGVSSHGYARPDRADDVLSTVLTLAQTGDVMVFGRTASKIELGLVYGAGSTFSVGPTTVTGMTAGLLASVGDILAVIAVGRTLTAAEKSLTHGYYTSRGAGALI